MLLRARPKTTKAPAVKATQHGLELAAECAQHVSKAPPPTRRVGTDMAGLRKNARICRDPVRRTKACSVRASFFSPRTL